MLQIYKILEQIAFLPKFSKKFACPAPAHL